MSPDQIYEIVVAALIAGCVTVGMIATAWASSRRRRSPEPPASPRIDVIEARLARMEHALDSIAIEIERVTEGQRFTAKLLAERVSPEGQGASSRPAQQNDLRRITPH
jgi:hypothetical protein